MLAGRQILFTIFKEFAKDTHLTDCAAYSHLDKIQSTKDIKTLELFLAVWDNLMLNFQTPPKPDHMYSAFLSNIRNIPELQEPLKKMNRLSLDDPCSSTGLNKISFVLACEKSFRAVLYDTPEG